MATPSPFPEARVRQLREPDANTAELAQSWGVSYRTAYYARCGKTHRQWDAKYPPVLVRGSQAFRAARWTDELVAACRVPSADLSALARQHGHNYKTLHQIRRGFMCRDRNARFPPCPGLPPAEIAEKRLEAQRLSAAARRAKRPPAPPLPDPPVLAMRPVPIPPPAADGGVTALHQLEGMLTDKRQLTEAQWAQLHRLRKTYCPGRYATMRAPKLRSNQL